MNDRELAGARIDAKQYAVVIRVGDRFFHKISATGRVITAWSLAGAKMYIPDDETKIDAMVEVLRKKKRDVGVYTETIKLISSDPF
jgi:hypothetical protein